MLLLGAGGANRKRQSPRSATMAIRAHPARHRAIDRPRRHRLEELQTSLATHHSTTRPSSWTLTGQRPDPSTIPLSPPISLVLVNPSGSFLRRLAVNVNSLIARPPDLERELHGRQHAFDQPGNPNPDRECRTSRWLKRAGPLWPPRSPIPGSSAQARQVCWPARNLHVDFYATLPQFRHQPYLAEHNHDPKPFHDQAPCNPRQAQSIACTFLESVH